MRSRLVFLIGAALLCLGLNATAVTLTLQPGSAAAFVFKPARAAIALTDTIPPNTTQGPTATCNTDTAATLTATIDEYGTGYYIAQLSSVVTPPSVATLQSTGTSFSMASNVATNVLITGLTASTSYTIYFVAKDSRNNVQPAVLSTTCTTKADSTPPVTTACPGSSTATDTTATFSVTINEAGTGHYLAQLASSGVPSLAAVKAGTAFAMAANTATGVTATGLTPSSNYVIYFIAQDTAGNWQTASSCQIGVTTTADTTPPVSASCPTLVSKGDTSVTVSATINENGTGYYLAKLAAASAPSIATIQSSGVSVAMTANVAANTTLTGLAGTTSYIIYFVAKDTSNNVQPVACQLAVTTMTGLDVNSISTDDGFVKANSFGFFPAIGVGATPIIIGRSSDGLFNRAILSFDTSAIPDGATITRAYLTVTYVNSSGDPWADPAANTIVVDVKNGVFGAASTMETADWGSAPTASAVATIAKFTSGTKTSSDFNATGLAAINKTGKTQIKLRFSSDQTVTNYVGIGEGANVTLHVEY